MLQYIKNGKRTKKSLVAILLALSFVISLMAVVREKMNRIIQEVSQAAKEQASGSKQIIGSVEGMTRQVTVATSEQKRRDDLVVKSTENISSIARANLAAVKQMTKSSDELVGIAETLLDSAARFKA